MFYLFYDPKRDNKIMGISDNKETMEFPYIETEENYHNLDNLVIIDGVIHFKHGTLQD